MSALHRCTACGNVVDDEELCCAACGREVERPGGRAGPALEQGLAGFDCRGCGASLTYDAGARALRCAFCGGTTLERQPGSTGRVRPSHLLPFRLGRDDAVTAFRRWLARGFWRPRRLAGEARLETLQAVYLPCWRFEGHALTCWTADSSEVPFGARAAWRPVAGRDDRGFADVLVLASGSLDAREGERLAPFLLEEARPYADGLAGDVPVEDVGLSRRGARPELLARVSALEAAAVPGRVPGRARHVHVNVRLRDTGGSLVLLPVWINAYTWRGRRWRFCVNGQTGRVVGRAPVSRTKVALALLLALAAAAGLVLLLAA